MDDVVRQLGQLLRAVGRSNPQGQLSDLDRFGRKIYTVQVFGQDVLRHLGCVRFAFGVGQAGQDVVVNIVQ